MTLGVSYRSVNFISISIFITAATMIRSQEPGSQCYTCSTDNYDEFDAQTSQKFSKLVKRPKTMSEHCKGVARLEGNTSSFEASCGLLHCSTFIIPLEQQNETDPDQAPIKKVYIRGCLEDLVTNALAILNFQMHNVYGIPPNKTRQCKSLDLNILFPGALNEYRNITICSCIGSKCNSYSVPEVVDDTFRVLMAVLFTAAFFLIIVVICFILFLSRHVKSQRKVFRQRKKEMEEETKALKMRLEYSDLPKSASPEYRRNPPGRKVMLITFPPSSKATSTASLMRNGTTMRVVANSSHTLESHKTDYHSINRNYACSIPESIT